MELMEHQLEAIENLSNGKILYGGVGIGKSATVMGYYEKNEKGKKIYVITTAKKRDSLDWEFEAARVAAGDLLTVDSWNNIAKYRDVEDAFFIFDEQRLVGSGVWVKSFIIIAKKNNWVMLTATPGDTWMDYIPVFVANNLYKNRTQFIREHVVYAPYSRFPKIVRYNDVRTLEKYRNMLLVEMPYVRTTHRNMVDVHVEFDPTLFRKVFVDRWNVYTEKPIQDVAELFRVMRRVVNSDASRLRAVRTLIGEHPRLIVYYNFDYELEELRKLSLEIGVTVAEWNGHKHQSIPQTDRWVYLVQYIAGAEAWNCTETDAMAFYSLTYSYKNFTQAMGRIDRLDTLFTELYYYVLMSDSVIDRAVRTALNGKKMFNERVWLENMSKTKNLG